MCRTVSVILLSLFCNQLLAQQQSAETDTLKLRQLDSVVIIATLKQTIVKSLPDVKGTYIFAAKKTEVINLDKLDINRVDNNPRQIFSKVPGVFVYETDGDRKSTRLNSSHG